MERVTLKIDGMTCGNCVAHVTKALKGIEGVTPERVSIGEVTVAYDPATTTTDRIASAIEDEGYAVVAPSR